MKSVCPSISKTALLLTILLINGCGSSVKQGDIAADQALTASILNLKLISSIGPIVADGISIIEPDGIVVSKFGDIFLSDKGRNSVLRFSSDLKFYAGEGGMGVFQGGFNRPAGLACDAALNLYVADSGNKRIQILDRNLRYARSIDSYYDDKGESVSFVNPEGLTLDSEGSLWIADDDRVLRLDPFYKLQLELSYNVPGGIGIGRAVDVAVSSNDKIAVADFDNGRVAVLSIYGGRISDFRVEAPSSVVWDNTGVLWVAQKDRRMITAFDIYGNPLFAYSDESPGSRPARLAVDSRGRLLITDSGLRKIMLFEIIRGSGDSRIR